MEEKVFNKWRRASGILFIVLVLGFTTASVIPAMEMLSVLFVLSGYFGGLVIAGKVGFDNQRMWMGITFLFPYVMLPVMYFRKYENAVKSKNKINDRNWNNALIAMCEKLKKIAELRQKSTLSSIMLAMRMSKEIAESKNEWQSLFALMLDSTVSEYIKIEGINVLRLFKNNDIANEIMERMRNHPEPEIKNYVADLESMEIEEKITTN